MPWLDYIWYVWIKIEIFFLQFRYWLFYLLDHVSECEMNVKTVFRQLSLLLTFLWGEQSQGTRKERPEGEVLDSQLQFGRKIACLGLKWPLSEGRRKVTTVIMQKTTSRSALHKLSAEDSIIYRAKGRANLHSGSSSAPWMLVPVVKLKQR